MEVIMLKALVNYIKANTSIARVLPEGGLNQNMGAGTEAYIEVHEIEKFGAFRSSNRNSTVEFGVKVCFPINHQIDLDNFVLFELFTALDRKVLTVTNGTTVSYVQMEVTSDVSGVNREDDGYISRERLVSMPCRWR